MFKKNAKNVSVKITGKCKVTKKKERTVKQHVVVDSKLNVSTEIVKPTV